MAAKTNESTRKIIVDSLMADITTITSNFPTLAQKLEEQMRQGNIDAKDHQKLAEALLHFQYPDRSLIDERKLSLWANPFFQHELFKGMIPSDPSFAHVWIEIAKSIKASTGQALPGTLFQYFLDHHKKAPDFPEKMLQAFVLEDVQKSFTGLSSEQRTILQKDFLKPVLDLAVQLMDKIIPKAGKYDYALKCLSYPVMLAAYLEQIATEGVISQQEIEKVLNQLDVFILNHGKKFILVEEEFKKIISPIISFWENFSGTTENKVYFLVALKKILTVIVSRDYRIRDMYWIPLGFNHNSSQTPHDVIFRYFLKETFHVGGSSSKEEAVLGNLFPNLKDVHSNTLLSFAETTGITKPLRIWLKDQLFRDAFNIGIKSKNLAAFFWRELAQREDWRTMDQESALEYLRLSYSFDLLHALLNREDFDPRQLPFELWFAYGVGKKFGR